MNSKSRNFYINSAIIATVSILLALVLNDLLSQTLISSFVRYLLILIITLLIYLFLSSSLIEHYRQQDENLKDLVENTLHELNTPIATIEANLSMLQNSIKDPKNRKRLSRISKASKKLTKLYDSIDKKIKDEIDFVQKEEFDLHEIVIQAIDNLNELSTTKEITIQDNTKPTKLFANRDGFLLMLENLISNGIKYNKKGGFIDLSQKNSTFVIKDSGIGIDTKNLFIIFDKSYQENPTTEGFGLGLYIVKNYCDSQKIAIKIDTKKDVGTSIMLDLTKIMQ